MKQCSEREIMSANSPFQIFSRDLDLLEKEKEEYLERFKPVAYGTIKNFLVTKKITLLYEEALRVLEGASPANYGTLHFVDEKTNKVYDIEYRTESDFKLGKMYITPRSIIFVVDQKYESYYKNFLEKTQRYPKPDRTIWEKVQYMVPNVVKHFKDVSGNFVIIVKKPCEEMYSLREIVDFYGGKLNPEYVASILSRLYYFNCYMDLSNMTHNALIIDNLFFAPGKFVEEGDYYTVDDMRIVGVYGGWFFTTYNGEKIKGMPKEVYDLMSKTAQVRQLSDFKTDNASIRRIARELLGDVTGNNLEEVPTAFAEWVNRTDFEQNAYEEFKRWKSVIIKSFGAHRFVRMDISIY